MNYGFLPDLYYSSLISLFNLEDILFLIIHFPLNIYVSFEPWYQMQQYSETTNLSLIIESLIKIESEGIKLLISCNYPTWRKSFTRLFNHAFYFPSVSNFKHCCVEIDVNKLILGSLTNYNFFSVHFQLVH